MFDCLAANSVFRTAVVVYADKSMPTVVPDNVTGAVTEIKSCLADRSTSNTLFVKLRGLWAEKVWPTLSTPELDRAKGLWTELTKPAPPLLEMTPCGLIFMFAPAVKLDWMLVKSIARTLLVKLRGLEVVKLSILLERSTLSAP